MNIEQQYKDYLSGKRVAVIGPSKSVMLAEDGALIDSYDVVVRLNNMLEISEEHQKYFGSRTDVVYATLDDPPKQIALQCAKAKVKFLSSSYPTDEWFFQQRMARNVMFLKNVRHFSTVTMPSEPYWTIKNKMSSRPNTGFCAIMDLLSSDLKELFIVGIDFYRNIMIDSEDAYFSDYSCQWSDKKSKQFLELEYDGHDHHNPDNDFRHFKYNMYLKDDRIKVSSFLEKTLINSEYESLSNCI